MKLRLAAIRIDTGSTRTRLTVFQDVSTLEVSIVRGLGEDAVAVARGHDWQVLGRMRELLTEQLGRLEGTYDPAGLYLSARIGRTEYEYRTLAATLTVTKAMGEGLSATESIYPRQLINRMSDALEDQLILSADVRG